MAVTNDGEFIFCLAKADYVLLFDPLAEASGNSTVSTIQQLVQFNTGTIY